MYAGGGVGLAAVCILFPADRLTSLELYTFVAVQEAVHM
jgi:hypothetical protein